MTSTIESHKELIEYINLNPLIFNQINYKFTVSEKLFDYYASIMPDSDNDCDTEDMTKDLIEQDIIQWMQDNNVVLKWTIDNPKNPTKTIKEISINTPI